jgi:hypothetical protein
MVIDDLPQGQRDRIIDELQRSGYPLEHRVATICHAAIHRPELGSGMFTQTDEGFFRVEADGTHVHIPTPFVRYPEWPQTENMKSNHRIVYRSARPTPQGQESAWREIDRAVEFQTYLEFGVGPEDALIGLEAQALIECKHRQDVILVGFPDPDQHPTSWFPAFGTMARTRMIRDIGQHIAQPYASLPRVSIGGVQQKGSGWHAYAEDLIYKATGSLYDYLVTTWAPWAEPQVHPFLREVGIWDALQLQMDHPLFSLSSWIHNNLKPEWCEQFNTEHVDWNSIPSFQLTVPIVCVDMPLAIVDIDPQGHITNLTSVPAFIVEERVSAWPGLVERVTYSPQPRWNRSNGAPVVVVHVDHLMEILIELADWACLWEAALTDGIIDEALVTAWPLEEAIWEAIGESAE